MSTRTYTTATVITLLYLGMALISARDKYSSSTSAKQNKKTFQLCTMRGPQEKEYNLVGNPSFNWTKKKIEVYFLDDDGNISKQILKIANSWKPFSGVEFVRSFNKANSNIRVSFRSEGWWSYIGNNSDQLSKDSVSISLHDLYLYDPAKIKSVVLHEFGHALGLLHEHQHPGMIIQWNTKVLFRYYRDTFGVDSSWVLENVIEKYKAPNAVYCEPDPHSIMIYAIPANVTWDGFHVDEPLDLSALDKKYIKLLYTNKDCK